MRRGNGPNIPKMQPVAQLRQGGNSEEILYSGSDDEYYEDPAERQRLIAIQAKRYLEGKPITIISAQLKGPFEKASGWQNPWRSRRSPGKKQAANVAGTLPRGAGQPMCGSFKTVPDTVIKPRSAPMANKVSSTACSSSQKASSANATIQSIAIHPAAGEAGERSSSLQPPSPSGSIEHGKPKCTSRFMDDKTWARVQAWREVVKPEFGSGAAKDVNTLQEQPSSSPRPGRKRPAAAEFLRKALASSKRLKASEHAYWTPATPSPVKQNHPMIHPNSSGTFGPVLPSTASTDGGGDVRPRIRSSARQEESVRSPHAAEKAIPRPPLVDYSSSYNTVPEDPCTSGLPDRTPTKSVNLGSRMTRSQEVPTSPCEGQPRSTFEQRLLSSPKVRGTSLRNPSISWRGGTPGQSQSRLRTPRTSPVAKSARSGSPATPVAIVPSQSPARLNDPRIIRKTQEELDAEFQSQADQSFQFRVKVRKASGPKAVSAAAASSSKLAKVISETFGKPTSKSAVSSLVSSADVDRCERPAETAVPCNIGEGEETSDNETASTQSEPDAEDETTEDTVQKDEVLEVVVMEEAVQSQKATAACDESDPLEVVMEQSITAKPMATELTEGPTLVEDKSLDVNHRENRDVNLPATNRLTMATSSTSEAQGEDEQDSAHHDTGYAATDVLERSSKNRPIKEKPSSSANSNYGKQPVITPHRPPASSPSYIADLGDPQLLPPLALTFSPLSSFFGNQADVSASTPHRCEGGRREFEPETPSLPVEPQILAKSSDENLKKSKLPATSSISTLESPTELISVVQYGQETSDRAHDAVHNPGKARLEDASELLEPNSKTGDNVHKSSSPLSEPLSSDNEELPQKQSPWSTEVVSIEQQAQPEILRDHQANNSQTSSPLSSPPSLSISRQQDMTEKTLLQVPAPPETPTSQQQHTRVTPPLQSSAQQALKIMSSDGFGFSRAPFAAELKTPVGGQSPTQQSPWMDLDPVIAPSLPNIAKGLAIPPTQDWYMPVDSQTQNPSQNPWQKNVGLTPANAIVPSSTGPASTPGTCNTPSIGAHSAPNKPFSSATSNGSRIVDTASTQGRAASAFSTPRTRTRSGSEALDLTDSIRPFTAFQTPSPERRRSSRPTPRPTGNGSRGARSVRSCLKGARIRNSDPEFRTRFNMGRRVTFASSLDMHPSSSVAGDGDVDMEGQDNLGAELPTTDATRSPPSRPGTGRAYSPPIQLSQSELPACTDKFYEYFAKMVRKGPQVRRVARYYGSSRVDSKARGPTGNRLLPSASQQSLGSPGFVAMAEAFIEAEADQKKDLDRMEVDDKPTVDNSGDGDGSRDLDHVGAYCSIGVSDEPESQDPVASVMDNLDSFIGAFDVDADLRKAREGLVSSSLDVWRGPRVEYDINANDDNDEEEHFDNTPKLGSYEREVLGQGVWD